MQGAILNSPSQAAVLTLNDTNNPCFSWARNPEASYYNVQLSLTPDFPTQRWLKTNLTSTSACWNNGSGWDVYGTSPLPVPARLEPGKTYYWRVISLNGPLGSQTDSMHSETRTFTVIYGINLTIDSPTANSTLTTENPGFSWYVSGYPVTGFDLQLSTTSSMTPSWTKSNAPAATSWNNGSGWTASSGAVPSLLPEGMYYVRVKAKVGSYSQYSTVRSFILKHPSAPNSPDYLTLHQSDNKGNFTLKWPAAMGYVGYYELAEQYKNGGWVSYNVGTVTQKSFSKTAYQIGTYRYKVRACNSAGCSDYSNIVDVDPGPPSIPKNVHVVSSDSSTGSIVLGWSAPDSAWYSGGYFQVDEGRYVAVLRTTTWTLMSGTPSVSGNDYRYPMSNRLGSVRYRVRACTVYGCSDYVEVPTTSMGKTPTAPGALPIFTLHQTDRAGHFMFKWTPASGDVFWYQLDESYNMGDWGNTVYAPATATTQTFSKFPYEQGTLRYRARACNDVGCGPYTDPYPVDPTAPSVPRNFRVSTDDQKGNFTLAWDLPEFNSTAMYYFVIEEKVILPDYDSPWSPAGNTDQLSESFANQSGTRRYRIKACNVNGCSETVQLGQELTGKAPEIPGPVPMFTLHQSDRKGNYRFQWAAAPGDVYWYEMQERFKVEAWSELDRIPASVFGASFSKSPYEVATWSYRLRACNTNGCGDFTAAYPVDADPNTVSDWLSVGSCHAGKQHQIRFCRDSEAGCSFGLEQDIPCTNEPVACPVP